MSNHPRVDPLLVKKAQDATGGTPSGYFVLLPPPDDSVSLDAGALIRFVLESWKRLAFVSLLCGITAVACSYLVTPVYSAETLIAPVSQDLASGGALASLRSQFGGLAQLAGLDMAGGGGGKAESIATLASKSFARAFIEREGLLPIIYAEKWDAGRSTWLDPSKAPTLDDAAKRFASSIRTISEDRRTGLVTLRVEWSDPRRAADWANGLVRFANERIRADAIQSAERSIEVLYREIEGTSVVGLREALFRLVESQINSKTLAAVKSEFAFRVIDPAVPDLKSKVRPKRALYGVAGSFLGGAIAFLVLAWGRRSTLVISRNKTAPAP